MGLPQIHNQDMSSHPSACVTDLIGHDPATPSGVVGPNTRSSIGQVLIQNKLAAHVFCAVTCSGVSSGGLAHPHPAPPANQIVSGSGTVFINNANASRLFPSGDKAACTATIGNGALVAACTVFIGGKSFINIKNMQIQSVIMKIGRLSGYQLQALNDH